MKEQPQSRPNSIFAEHTVLIVDDSENIADVFAVIVRIGGCLAITAHNGFEAIRKAIEKKPDLILMDISMPEMDGYEATRRILAIPELSKTPIIAISAHSVNEYAARAKQAGCVGSVTKPVDPMELETIIRRYIGHCN